VPVLASVAELATYTDTEIAADDPGALLALEFATGIVQAETRQTLFYVPDDTVILAGGAGRLALPERPVIGTPSVVGLVSAVHWHYSGNGVLTYGPASVVGNVAEGYAGRWPTTVTVTYSHGYTEIPADLRNVVLSIAARLLTHNNREGLIVSETVGAYSVTYARAAVVAGELAAHEQAILSRYRLTAWSAPQ
jgi:hypothetical protein